MKLKLTGLFLLAFLFRLVALNQSLWLDEATTANVVHHFSYLQIITKFAPTDFHPPLFYLLEKFWISLFGYSEIALRFPSVLASLLTGYFVYNIGKKLKNSSVGAWAAAFFLFNPLIIYYSQEARMYSLVTLFLIAALYFFLQKKYFLYNFFAALALSTHYAALFFLLSIFSYLLIKKQHRFLLLCLPGPLLAFLLLFPLTLHQYLSSRTALLSVTHWSLVLGKSNLKNLLLIPLKFVTGRLSFYPKILYYLLGGFAAFLTFFVALISRSKLLKYLLFCPLLLAFFVSFSSPMLQYFRYLYLLPVLCLLLAAAPVSVLLKRLILLIFITFASLYLFNSNFHREDWRSLAASLPQNALVYMIPSFADPIKYYRSDIVIQDLRGPIASPALVIPYGADIFGIDISPFHQISVRSYRQLTLELWQK